MIASMEVVIVLVVLGSIVGLVHWGNQRGIKQRTAWKATAEGLGLSQVHGPKYNRHVHARRYLPELYGPYDGTDIYIGTRVYTTGSGKSQQTHYYSYIDVPFEIPLKRGVQLGRADGVSKFFGSIFGQLDLQIGHEQLDRDFRIKGQDPAQITALFSSPELRALLLVDPDPYSAYVTDVYVRFEIRGIQVDLAELRAWIPRAVALQRAVAASWAALPPSVEEARLEAPLRRVCERARLDYTARGMRGLGRARDVDTRIEVVLDDKVGWCTELESRFDPDLAVGLKVTREGVIAGITKLFGSQDIVTGDKTFDDHYLIKGKDPELVKQILSPDARKRLLDLHARCDELIMTDSGVLVRLHRIVDDPDALVAMFTEVTDAANDMVSHRKVSSVGVYR